MRYAGSPLAVHSTTWTDDVDLKSAPLYSTHDTLQSVVHRASESVRLSAAPSTIIAGLAAVAGRAGERSSSVSSEPAFPANP